MASPTPPVESTDTEGEGLLERIGAQIATLATQVSEMDQRMANVESGTPSRPVEVQLSAETVGQIADALAALQAAGSLALDEAFKSASDDLTEALSGLVRAEISKTLADAGYTVEVSEVTEPAVGEEALEQDAEPAAVSVGFGAGGEELPEAEPLAASVRPGSESATMPSIVAPLATGSADAVEQAEAALDSIGSGSIRDASDEGEDDDNGPDVNADRPPLALEELDDPFLDALIRKEPLSA